MTKSNSAVRIKGSRFKVVGIVALAAILGAGSRPARAQFFGSPGASTAPVGNIEGFTVSGKGTVLGKPNRLEIDLEVSASSELSADAIVKYRDTKKRLQEAFAALKLDNVTVEERGLLVDQKGVQINPYFFDAQPNRRSKAEVQLTRRLVVKCSEIRKLDEEALLQLVAKLLDVAQDAGGKVTGGQNNFNPYYYYDYSNRSSTGLVRFILDDYDKLEDEAYAKAVADAEARAQRLARLSHVKLGPVTAVREAASPGSTPTGAGMNARSGHDDDNTARRLESSRYQEIPVQVELVVRFDVSANPPGNGRTGD